ncbi:hypothetical protein J2783_000391 [Chryseobacterium sediminis]|nr:hypothetical protein [Chryseobacterium sediminis]
MKYFFALLFSIPLFITSCAVQNKHTESHDYEIKLDTLTFLRANFKEPHKLSTTNCG